MNADMSQCNGSPSLKKGDLGGFYREGGVGGVEMIENMELPNNWEILKLGQIATYINGKAFKPSEWSKEGLPIIRIQNLNRKKSEFNFCNFSVDDKYYVNKGDLLFAWSGTPDTSFGAHIWLGERAVLNQHIFRIVINKKKITKEYYLYALNHKVKEFVSKAHGTAGLAHITKKKFEESEIALPFLPEQNQIVAKIEELFSELDDGIESLKKAREQLKTYRQAVLKYAFEGKLTEEWRARRKEAGNPPEPAEKLLERIKAEREKHYQKQIDNWKKACEQAKADGKKKPTKPRKPKELPPLTEKELEELSALPEEWGWTKLGTISESMKNGIYKPKEFYAEDGTPCLRMYNIENGRIEWFDIKRMILSEDEIKEYELISGDLLVNRVNSRELVGKTALIKHNIERSVYESKNIRLRLCNNKNINSGYVNYWFLIYANGYFNSNAQQTVGMASINQEQIGSMPFPISSAAEQKQIVTQIESRLSVCDQLEQTIEDSLKKSEALRQSILKKAFSGELTKDWREKHPELVTGENSAEKLLERIKAEKALLADRKKQRRKKTKKK